MNQFIAQISILVRDYDEAIAYYTQALGFDLVEDTPLEGGKRWVLVAPRGAKECRLLLAKAKDEKQLLSVGRQSGGRVFLFLRTDDFWRDYAQLKARGVNFIEEPRRETYGDVVVFEDLYGNKWDFIGPLNKDKAG